MEKFHPDEEERLPFNDAIDHGDLITGYRRAKRLDQYPSRMRVFLRIIFLLLAIGTIVSIVYSVVK